MSQSSDDDEEEFYEVERILDDKLDDNGERIYFIKWKNYGTEMNTWEPEGNLSCPDLLELYLEQKARRLKDTMKKKKLRSLTTKKDGASKKDSPIPMYRDSSNSSNSSNNSNNSSNSNSSSSNNSSNGINGNHSVGNKIKALPLSVSDTMRSFLTKTTVPSMSITPPASAPLASAPPTPAALVSAPVSIPTASSPTASTSSPPVSALSSRHAFFSLSPSPPLAEEKRTLDKVYKWKKKKTKPKTSIIIDDDSSNDSDNSSNDDGGLTNNETKRQKKSFELSNAVQTKGISSTPPPPKSSPGPSAFGGIKRANQQRHEQEKTPIETLIDQISGSRAKDNTNHPAHQSLSSYTTVSRHERHKQHSAVTPATPTRPHENHSKSPPTTIITERPIDRAIDRLPMWTGAITIKKMGYYGMQFFNDSDSPDLKKEALSFLNSSELSANTAISFRIFKHLCKDNDILTMTVQPSEKHYLNWSKLSKFMQINNQVIVVLSPKQPTEAILLANTLKQENLTVEPTPFFRAVYLRNLRTDYIPEGLPGPLNLLVDSHFHPNWKVAATVLGFTKEMADFGKDRGMTLEVIGTSELSNLLRLGCRLSTTEIPTTEASSLARKTRVMFFDRSNSLLNTTCLNEERACPDTRIFEFGYRHIGQPIYPALEVYPKYTGGFITTDARNILQNCDILDRMVDFAGKNNTMLLGSCTVILHPDILRQIMRSGTGIPATNAISKILTFLTTNEIAIMENWNETADPLRWKNATMDWFQVLAEANLNNHQLFYFVEDIVPCDTYQSHYPCVDFISSSNLTM